MVMDTPAPDISSSGTSIANQETISNLAHSQTTGEDLGLSKKAAKKAKKKAKKKAEKIESKKDKKKYRNEFNKIVKKLVEDGHVNGGESVVGDVTPGQINEPESSTVIWSPALAQQNNATMGIEDSEHMHDLLHSFLFGNGDDDSGPPLMNLGENPQRIPHSDMISGTDSNYFSGRETSGNHTSMLLNIAETTTAIVDSGQTPESVALNNIPSGTPPALLGQDPEGDDDDPHPTAKESGMAGGVDSTVKESDMAGVVDSTIKESGMAGEVDFTFKESEMVGNVVSTIKTVNPASSPGAGEGPKQSITIHVHHPPDRNKTLSLKRKWKKSCKRDYYNLPQGRQCCLRAVRCFDHLPEILDEIENYDDTQTNRLLVCSHVRSSLTCMSSTLKQKQCRSTAKAINEKFKPQLSTINNFFDPKCINTGQKTTTTTTTLAPQGEGQTGSGSDSHMNAGIIGASVGGFILIGLILLIILFVRRKMPKRGQSKKKTSRDNDVNNKRESSRYQDMEFNRVQRQHSDVYAEIDERSMHSFRNPEMNGYLDPDGVRPLPSAPPDGTVPEDQHGYLTPQIRKDSAAPVVEEATGGYTVLQSAEDGTVSYTTLKPTETDDDADYISPDEDAASPKRRSVPGSQGNTTKPTPKPRQPSTGEEPYHAYFILEKENIEHV
ncbi:uncharacterized protein LOC117331577 [Pecten maximus]|uniref:uncharacterized protein LOC117331577 n=1 Tax=Pecten maximus TaxID=6579 RepID=UPI00145854B1|nr:uncharacterized protein LOC117331577 [Pecten maximus]